MKNIIFIAALATSIVFASCNSNKTETHGEETEHHDEHENTNTAMLTAEQMKSIKIELSSIEKKQLTASLKANGILKVPNQNRANATASLGGVIKSILVQTGNTVSKGSYCNHFKQFFYHNAGRIFKHFFKFTSKFCPCKKRCYI